jgi:hypothetical protein
MYIRYKRLEVKKTICIVTEGEQLKLNIHFSESDGGKKETNRVCLIICKLAVLAK